MARRKGKCGGYKMPPKGPETEKSQVLQEAS